VQVHNRTVVVVQAESAGPAKPCDENEGLDGGGARRPG